MTQVISAIDFAKAKINHGEQTTTSVLNRQLLACMDADARLEESVQYIARSMSLAVTEYTRFLCHCDGEGVDVIGTVRPTLSAMPEDTFKDDGMFYGSAFVQSGCKNLLGDVPNFDSSLRTLNGWVNRSPGAANTNVMVNRRGITITNSAVHADITPGTAMFTTPDVPVKQGRVSFGIEMSTQDNLAYNNIVAGITATFKNAASKAVNVRTVSTNTNKYRGMLVTEGFTVPTDAVTVVFTVYVDYATKTSKGAVTFKNLMLEQGDLLHTWTSGTRGATSATYEHVVNTAAESFSVLCWNKFNINSAKNHVGPVGPIFLVDSTNTLNIGAVHDAADGGTYRMRLRVIKDGVVTYGEYITVPQNCFGVYIPAMVRLTKLGSSIRVEYVTVDLGLNVYRSTVELPEFALPQLMDIRLGTDGRTTDYYNSPITEVRYDDEWLNDFEFSVIALSRHPFSIGDRQFITMDDLRTYLDGIGINLVKNPDGRLGLYHWRGVPNGNFINIVSDATIGSGFLWNGSATKDAYIESEPIRVVSSNPYVFRAELSSDASAVGSFGIALRFFKSDDTQTGNTEYSICMNGFGPEYYSIIASAPANASYAKVCMYVMSGFKATRATWSRIKFELGSDPTMFTDDSSPKHALLAP